MTTDPPQTLAKFEPKVAPAVRYFSDRDRGLIGALRLVHEHGSPKGLDIARPATFVVEPGGRIAYAHAAGDVLDRPEPKDVFDSLQRASGPSLPKK